ncbi:MAG: hypothetical protein JEY94_00215 [Melioribacteraceae bacterium]|nr:hypothetical protein [Melioribacteraceae bacterium]
MKKINIVLLFLAVIVVVNCTDKFDPEISAPAADIGNINDTVYIEQKPYWSGFNNPQDMIIGKDGFIYVCDTDNDRVVMMDVAGHVLGFTKPIKHPIAIEQDHRKDLFVCAKFDTLIDNSNITYSAVYQIEMYPANHIISEANIFRLLPKTSFDYSRPDREYKAVTVFHDNSIYVARTGSVNSGTSDPDNSIRVFRRDGYKDGDRLAFIEPIGSGLVSANNISSLTSFNSRSYDMVISLVGKNSFKVQWLNYIDSGIEAGKYYSGLGVSSDMMTIGKFGNPEDVCIDNSNNVYIADAEKDSVYKFNSFGDELQSFGGSDLFNKPHAVAHFDRTLYVLDTGNDRIIRFILSTEID